jgi:hypothetical protein
MTASRRHADHSAAARLASARAAPPGRGGLRHNGAMRTIALEEHFWTAGLAAPPGTGPLARPDGARLDEQLRDLGPDRIAGMDAAGIDVQVLSHSQPAAQGLTGTRAADAARATG